MVVASLGVFKTDQELCELCDCTPEGTMALSVIDAARTLLFKNSCKGNLTLDELETELERGLFPIAYVGAMLPASKLLPKHAIVVVAIKGDQVQALDPAHGEITLSKEQFLILWNDARRFVILIE